MSDNPQYKHHPIQLKSLKVLELSIKLKQENQPAHLLDTQNFKIRHGHSEFDISDKSITVKIVVEIAEDEKDSPFSLKAELMGLFVVDDALFPTEHIYRWARENAPLILYPYLREHVHGLTSRAGFEGMLLPLFQLPTFDLMLTEKPTPHPPT